MDRYEIVYPLKIYNDWTTYDNFTNFVIFLNNFTTTDQIVSYINDNIESSAGITPSHVDS
jgi:hypothetical protein